ncbi:MAG TPA: hypothetical protein VFI62_14210 [Burkholderiales bacterium]|nr:hypothetical protein [Burkholderiales bacterium]
MEVDMHKVLQALIDTILLAAGSVELGSAAHPPSDSAQNMPRHAAAKRSPEREQLAERAGRLDPQPFPGESALRPSAEKSQP